MTVYVKVVNTATIEIDDAALEKAGMTLDDLYGYPVRDLEEKGVEYQLEVDDDQWETGASNGSIYRYPKRAGE